MSERYDVEVKPAAKAATGSAGHVYYGFNRDWFAMGSVFLNYTPITHFDMASSVADPAVIGLTGFLRIAYRF